MPFMGFFKRSSLKSEKRKYSSSDKKNSIDNAPCPNRLQIPNSISYRKSSDTKSTGSSRSRGSRSSGTIEENLPFIGGERRSSGDYPELSSYSHYDQWLQNEKYLFDERLKHPPTSIACIDDFEALKQLGKGQFGNVILVLHRNTNERFALKILSKEQIAEQKILKNVINEKCVLYGAQNPFIIGLIHHFRDEENLYMVMDYIDCGDMFTHIQNLGKFTESLTRFYAAQIVLAFEYLHNLQLIYRDLKPENIMIDSKGFLKLIDLGFVKRVPGRTYTLVGTPAYLSPEIILAKGYNKAVDWWTLGILCFEMMSGLYRTPFYDENIMAMYEKIHVGKVYFPRAFSVELKDLLRQLLQTSPAKRLGNSAQGSTEIKNHSWFVQINWVNLFNKETKPPWKPEIEALDEFQLDEKKKKSLLTPKPPSPSRTSASDRNNNKNSQNSNVLTDF